MTKGGRKRTASFDPTQKPSLKSMNLDDYKRIVEILYEEIARKDKQIDSLKEENEIIMKTAVKAQEKNMKLLETIEKMRKD